MKKDTQWCRGAVQVVWFCRSFNMSGDEGESAEDEAGEKGRIQFKELKL